MEINNNNNDVFSGIAGYASIVCWIIVLLPQIWTNYKRKSGESLSLTFLYIWVAGDILNLIGAILQHLLTPMIILAVYYTITDTILIFQVCYYHQPTEEMVVGEITEITPLINNNSALQSRDRKRIKQLSLAFFLFGVPLTGVAYLISNRPEVVKKDSFLWILDEPQPEMKFLPQIFGWASAFLYLGSRIPQILKNYRYKSTDGLSLAMFCFSLLGNLTYCLSIVLHSTDQEYLLINLPWLLGSGGTTIFDLVIFVQFYMYRK